MASFLLKRLFGLVVVLLAMTLMIFCLQQVIPADPARAIAGPNAPAAVVEAKRIALGLDQPLLTRYARYLRGIAGGDFGTSVRTHNPVAIDLAAAFPASLELMAYALVFGAMIGVALGVAQTVSGWGRGLGLVFTAGASLPIFLIGLILIFVVWFKLGLAPFGGRSSMADPPQGPTTLLTLDSLLAGDLASLRDALWHLLLPAICLGLPVAVAIGRSTHASLAGVMRQNYIKTARSKGLGPTRVVLRHGLRNAMAAPLAMFGLQFGFLFGNLLIIERIFSWPGVGLYAVGAFSSNDLPAILGISLVFGTAYVVLNILIDLAQAALNPTLASF